MLYVDLNLLVHVGFHALGRKTLDRVLDEYREILERRVGARVADLLTPEDADALRGYISTGQLIRASEWLDANLPEHRVIAMGEFAALVGEIAKQAPLMVGFEVSLGPRRVDYERAFAALDRASLEK